MKRTTRLALLLGILSVLLCVSALAAETESEKLEAGFYFGSETTTGLTVTPKASGGVEPTEKNIQISGAKYTYFAGSDKLSVSKADGTEGKEYLVMLVEGTFETAPTANNKILYIDQISQESDGAVDFDVFPMTPGETTLTLLVTSNDGSAMCKQVLYYGAEGNYDVLQYTLGDIDDSGKILSNDALFALQMSVNLGTWTPTQRLAADVNLDGKVLSNDALFILQKSVNLPTVF